jgi:hypothetical protein
MGEEEYEDDERSVCKEQMKKQICTFEVKNWLMTVIFEKNEKETDEKSIST